MVTTSLRAVDPVSTADEADRRVGGERSGQVDSPRRVFAPSPVIRQASDEVVMPSAENWTRNVVARSRD